MKKRARRLSMQNEFDHTRDFLRQCMAAIVKGELSHQQAGDIVDLAQQQNYNMALEATLFPGESKPIEAKGLVKIAAKLVGDE